MRRRGRHRSASLTPALLAPAVLAAAAVLAPAGATAAPQVQRLARATPGVEAERLALPSSAGLVTQEAGASGGAGLLIWSDAAATGPLTTSAATSGLSVVARGDQCQGAPSMTVSVDGRAAGTVAVAATTWTSYALPGSWGPGAHRVSVAFGNDAQAAGCDRNLRVDRVSMPATASAPVPPPATAPVTGSPLAGARFWVDPSSNARQEAARRSDDAAARTALLRIADQPNAEWIGDWVPTSSVASRVASVVAAGRSAGTVPVLVLYAVPHRDCGSYSAGGLRDTAAYAAWVRQVRAGLGTGRAVVVVEPDALAQLDCLPSDADRRARTAALKDAVGVLAGAPGAVTYLDAGTSRWIAADAMAQRLRDAGVAQARGFSLNVSNFGWTDAEAAYGDQLVARLPGSHYVVDTSRNGRGPGDTWCNPAGRALGPVPTSSTGRANADAYLWVKRVGESDGECGRGEPAAGTWWPDYAIGLSLRAAG
ncbi:glycoside hydrolase family 6 protein [Kineococcus rubinsiae]|uniref:glycoside hydrolase family 6 protein n=1 Tax=Kineococcus rubinsiae TaxID=2609562 RepID=UPI00142FB416|nr:glycoside hydrolase family 6 protein [Kineococcus rubinsiae]NIZ91681.1 hypothetical protein [Kineococcus rubinsiae]